jgi:pimeloyl-ACP methyl ester carboxylesterase
LIAVARPAFKTRYYSQAWNCDKIPPVPQPEKATVRQEIPWASSLKRLTVSGYELRYLRYGAGRPLVLAHTLRTQLDYFLPLIRVLGNGFEILAPDLPGHGHSGAPVAEYTAEYFINMTERFLDACDIRNAIFAGESIGASIGLGLAARQNPRITHVVALNPYDYGRWGGIRRSSALANVVFTAMLWPAFGAVVARAGTKGLLRLIMQGGLHDPRKLPPELVDELHRCGSMQGHARAFRSLCLHWRTWIAARAAYSAIRAPVTLIYGDHDWSRQEDRDANVRALPGARRGSLQGCGHFSSLEHPERVAQIIREASE